MTSETAGADPRTTIREFILARFPLAAELKPADGDSLLDAGVVDSLGILDIVTFLEESFGVQVADEDLNPENFDSIEALVGFVKGRG